MTEQPGPGDGFRAFEEITLPDPRRERWWVPDEQTGKFRPYRLEEFHAAIGELGLDKRVPLALRVQFDNARNALLYSWYVYRFVQLAELQALRTLEFGLREVFGIARRSSRHTLQGLVKRAVVEERLNAAEIAARVRARRDEPYRVGISTPAWEFEAEEESEAAAYLEALAEGLGWYRNELAHGGRMLAPGGFHVLDVCRMMIDQLFGKPRRADIDARVRR